MRYLVFLICVLGISILGNSQELVIVKGDDFIHPDDYDPLVVIRDRSPESCLQMQSHREAGDDAASNNDGPVIYKFIEFPMEVAIDLRDMIVNNVFNCDPIYIQAEVGSIVTYIGPIEFEFTRINSMCGTFKYHSQITPRIIVPDCAVQVDIQEIVLKVVTTDSNNDYVPYNWQQDCLGMCGHANTSINVRTEICCDGDSFVSRTISNNNNNNNNFFGDLDDKFNSVEVYNLSGVLLGQISKGNVLNRMKSMNLNNGIYILKYFGEENYTTKKIAFVN